MEMLRALLRSRGVEDPTLVEREFESDSDGDDGMRSAHAHIPCRYDVGDEVDIMVDPRGLKPPYESARRGESYWKRGVIVKKWAAAREFDTLDRLPFSFIPPMFPYAVRLHENGEVWPVAQDDPDNCRATAPKHQTGYEGLRFKVGDLVECAIGKNEWLRGTVRELHKPYPAWGRGWTEDGDPIPGVTQDTAPYHVTPEGKTFKGDYASYDNIMVPADNDGFVRKAR